MNGDTPITITGNLVDEPELRFTPAGQPVARFRIASVPRVFDKAANEWRDGDGLFLTVNIWRHQAEHVCESLNKGTRVVVTGRLKQRSYETKEGEKRTVLEVGADEVAPSLRSASAKVTKVSRSRPDSGAARSSSGQGSTGGGSGGGDPDPWATAEPGGFSDEPPF